MKPFIVGLLLIQAAVLWPGRRVCSLQFLRCTRWPGFITTPFPGRLIDGSELFPMLKFQTLFEFPALRVHCPFMLDLCGGTCHWTQSPSVL